MKLLATKGESYYHKLCHSYYNLLWIATPNDWLVRTPGKRTTAHWQRVKTWVSKATSLNIHVVLFGPPRYFWKLPPIRDLLADANLYVGQMRLCHFNGKFDPSDKRPSGSYLQIATNHKVNFTLWKCTCNVSWYEHSLDCYGQIGDVVFQASIYPK